MSAPLRTTPRPVPVPAADATPGPGRAPTPARGSARRRVAEDATLLALRVMAGLMLVQHGLQKHFGLLLPPDRPPGAPAFASLPWLAGWLEIVGGLLVAAGLLTRATAFLLAGTMAVAYFMSHAPRGFWPILNRGELAVLYCFVFLYLAARGAGRFGVDALLARRRAGGRGG